MGRKVKGLQEHVNALDVELRNSLALLGKISIVVEVLIEKGVITFEEINEAAKRAREKAPKARK